MEWFVWMRDESDSSLAWVEDIPAEIDKKSYLLREGVEVASWFPDDVTLELSAEYGTRTGDVVPNTLEWLIVSPALRDILAKSSGARWEFLPVSLKTAKGRAVKKEYFIANLLDPIACLDKKASDFEMDAIDKSQVDWFRVLALDESKVPKGTKIFRLAEKTTLVLIEKSLGVELREAKLSGLFFRKVEKYGAEFR